MTEEKLRAAVRKVLSENQEALEQKIIQAIIPFLEPEETYNGPVVTP